MKTDLAKNTILLAIGSVVSKGLLFVMLPFFSAWLSTGEFGTYDLLSTYVSLLVPFLTLAVGEGVFRYSVDGSDEDRKKYITNGLALILFNYVIFIVVIMSVNAFYRIQYIGAFLLYLFGSLLNNYVSSYLRATKQLKIHSFSNAFSVIIIAVMVTIFVYVLNLGVTGMLLGYAIGSIVGDGIIFFVSKLHKNISLKTIKMNITKELIKYSSPLILNNISWWFMNVSDRTLIIKYMGSTANGIYAIACKIPTLCTAIFSMFNISWQQTVSQMIGSKEIEEYLNSVYRQMLRILCSICSGVLACNFIFFNCFFEDRYFEAHKYVGILITAAMLLSLSQFYGGVQIALKKPGQNGYTTTLGAIINVILNFILIEKFGLLAAALTTLIGNGVILFTRKLNIRKNYAW